jgi:hypothetical protein
MKKTLYTLLLLFATYLTALAQVPNAGFESWDSLSFFNGVRIYDPMEWMSSNAEMVSIGKSQSISMSTDAHTGSYAAKIISMVDDGQMQGSLLISSKFPLTGRIKYFDVWYKYTPVNTDSFRIYLAMYKNGQSYGQAYALKGETQNTYSKIHWELTYPDNVPAPDSASFIIQASIYNDSEGSVLLLDDIAVGYQATGSNEVDQTPQITSYPNPVVNEMTFLGCPPKKVLYVIRNSKGAVVKEGALDSGSLSTHDLAEGMYFVQLNCEDGWKHQQKFIKQ